MKKTIRIDGMMCAHCVQHVTDALGKVEGVKKADVSLKKAFQKHGTAVVELEHEVSDDVLTAAVTEAGYTVVSVG